MQTNSPLLQVRGQRGRNPDGEYSSSSSDGSAEGRPQLHAEPRPEEPGRRGQPGVQRVQNMGGTGTGYDDLVHNVLDQEYACRSKSMRLQRLGVHMVSPLPTQTTYLSVPNTGDALSTLVAPFAATLPTSSLPVANFPIVLPDETSLLAACDFLSQMSNVEVSIAAATSSPPAAPSFAVSPFAVHIRFIPSIPLALVYANQALTAETGSVNITHNTCDVLTTEFVMLHGNNESFRRALDAMYKDFAYMQGGSNSACQLFHNADDFIVYSRRVDGDIERHTKPASCPASLMVEDWDDSHTHPTMVQSQLPTRLTMWPMSTSHTSSFPIMEPSFYSPAETAPSVGIDFVSWLADISAATHMPYVDVPRATITLLIKGLGFALPSLHAYPSSVRSDLASRLAGVAPSVDYAILVAPHCVGVDRMIYGHPIHFITPEWEPAFTLDRRRTSPIRPHTTSSPRQPFALGWWRPCLIHHRRYAQRRQYLSCRP